MQETQNTPPKKKGKPKMVTVCITPKQHAALKKSANRRGMKIAARADEAIADSIRKEENAK